MPDLRIIPLTSPADLPVTVETFLASLIGSWIPGVLHLEIANDPLPRCDADGSLSRQATEELRHVGRSLRELLGAVANRDRRDRIMLALGQDEAAQFLAFWTRDSVLD